MTESQEETRKWDYGFFSPHMKEPELIFHSILSSEEGVKLSAIFSEFPLGYDNELLDTGFWELIALPIK